MYDLFEGFTGSRQERCSKKILLQIDVPFNYFDSTKNKKEKVDGIHAEKIKTLLVIHPLVQKSLLAAMWPAGHPCSHLLYKLGFHLQHTKSIQRHELPASLLETGIWGWLLQTREMGLEKKSDPEVVFGKQAYFQ